MKSERSTPRGPTTRKKAPARAGKAREFNVLIEQDEDGWYVASVPELPGCHTQARSLDVLLTRIREAATACLAEHDSASSPKFLGVQRIAV